ncbi:hypothetical protein DSO57_1013615 [Entomophthora muscae]|uniref:Uncharacterized protein n=1 Tax=Entomophthora muscae TaxID=34485 RepID=A0ACC2SIK7_9FUNG|nr:hypothetical protein DSO57_1013615 [Entomophthora muscae]
MVSRSTTHPSTSVGPRLQSASMDDYSPRTTSPAASKSSLPVASHRNRFRDQKNSNENLHTILNFNYKRLQELPEDVEKRIELEKLSLAYNLLTSLPKFIVKFQNLVSVNLRSNNFLEFPRVLCHLPNLTILDISRNRIRYLPKEPRKLLNLQMFNISRNQLVLLPSYLAKMSHLEKLKLEANPFSQNNELFVKERIQDHKDWPKNLFHYLKEVEATGREGISSQFSKGSIRANMGSASTPSSPQRHHLGRDAVHSPPTCQQLVNTKSKGSRHIGRPLMTDDCRSDIDSEDSSNDEQNLVTQRPGRLAINKKEESPDSSPFPSPTESSSLLKGKMIMTRERDVGLDVCTAFFVNPKPHHRENNEKFRAFEKTIYCSYFLIERTENWLKSSIDGGHLKELRTQLISTTTSMVQLLGHTEIPWNELESTGKRLTMQLVKYTQGIQASLTEWGDTSSFPLLQSLSFVLLESMFHLKDACASMKKAYPTKLTSELSPDISLPQEPVELPTPQSLVQPLRTRPPSPLFQSLVSIPQDKPEAAAYNPPEQNQLHLSAHMATSSAFKCIQLLGEHTFEHSSTLDTAIQMAEDSTHLLVSSLNLVASSPAAAPLPLCQRFVQDIFSFVKDIIHLTQVVKSHFLTDSSRLAVLPLSLVSQFQTLTHATKQLAGLLSNQQENVSAKSSLTLGV